MKKIIILSTLLYAANSFAFCIMPIEPMAPREPYCAITNSCTSSDVMNFNRKLAQYQAEVMAYNREMQEYQMCKMREDMERKQRMQSYGW